MAVIDVYQNNSQVGAPAQRTSSVRPDMSGQLALAKADAGLTNTLVEGGQKLYEQMAVADVMKANNDYNMQMNKLQTELLQNKEENARDNLTKYEEGRQKIIEGIMKKGPATLRGALGQKAFFNTVDRDWAGQRTQMERYTMGEMEKYQDTQLNNQYQLALKDIAANWNDEEALGAAIRRGEFMTAARYANYGQEKIKEAGDKWKAAVVSTAAQAAINADTSEGWARGGAILQGYGYLMNADDRLRFDKMISAREKANNELNTFANIYAKYGNDVEGGIAEVLKNYTGTADVNKGLDFARGEEGKAWGSNQCANFVKRYIQMAGGDGDIGSSLADGTYLNAQKKGLTFADRKQLRDGDVVYWQVDGSSYAASDNPEDVHSDSKAYKGITHVGVYDAKTGKVIQSGEHGVSAMDMDTKGYHVVGFSHIGGRAMDAAEREELTKNYRQYAMQNIQRKKENENLIVENAADEMFAAYNSGVRDPAYFDSMAKRIAGNDYSVYNKLETVAKALGKSSVHKLTVSEMEEIEDAIDEGNLPQEELVQKLSDIGCNPETIMKYVHKNKAAAKAAAKAAGANAFDWGSVMSAFYARMGGSSKVPEEWRPGLKRYAKRAVKEYIAKEKQPPSVDWVLGILQDGVVKGVGGVEFEGAHFWNSNTSYNMAQLANHNIYSIKDADAGYVNVWFYGNAEPVRMSKEAFKQKMGE